MSYIHIFNYSQYDAFDVAIFIDNGVNYTNWTYNKNLPAKSTEPIKISMEPLNKNIKSINEEVKNYDYLIKFTNSKNKDWYYRKRNQKISYLKNKPKNFNFRFSKVVSIKSKEDSFS